MWNYRFWLLLTEQLDRNAYNGLFDEELNKLLPALTHRTQRQHLELMHGFNWTGYIAAAVRRAGITSPEEVDERVHEIVVRLLVSPGGLFRDYEERRHGPFDLRFRRAVGNAVRNLVEKERNRRRYIPSVAIRHDFVPGGVTVDDLAARAIPNQDATAIDGFRELVLRRLGEMALRVLDARLEGLEMRSLPGLSSYTVKVIVQSIKKLAKDYAEAVGDFAFLREVERLMASEAATVQRRRDAMQQKVKVGPATSLGIRQPASSPS